MITTDEDALICDLAETYHIFDYKSLPLSKVATFSVGLRDDSRIKMKMNGLKYSFETILFAAITDRLSQLIWMQSEDAQHGTNRPVSIVGQLLEENGKEIVGFDTPEDFQKEWKKIMERGEMQWQEPN